MFNKIVLRPTITKIPGRVYKDSEGRVIYSKVDKNNVDLTEDNCEGWIIHTSSYFSPKE